MCCSLTTDEIRNELYQEDVLPDRNVEWVDEGLHRSSFNVCPSRAVPAVLEDQARHKVMQSVVCTMLLHSIYDTYALISNGASFRRGCRVTLTAR